MTENDPTLLELGKARLKTHEMFHAYIDRLAQTVVDEFSRQSFDGVPDPELVIMTAVRRHLEERAEGALGDEVELWLKTRSL